MRRFLFIFLIIIFITTNFCKKKDKNEIREEFENGIKIIYNPELPLRGEISLKLKEVFKINAGEVDSENPPGFGEFHKDKNGNIYKKLIGITEGSESDSYIEYEITNYKKIFTSKNI